MLGKSPAKPRRGKPPSLELPRMSRTKYIRTTEFAVVFSEDWAPAILEGDAMPAFARAIPDAVRCCVIASGQYAGTPSFRPVIPTFWLLTDPTRTASTGCLRSLLATPAQRSSARATTTTTSEVAGGTVGVSSMRHEEVKACRRQPTLPALNQNSI